MHFRPRVSMEELPQRGCDLDGEAGAVDYAPTNLVPASVRLANSLVGSCQIPIARWAAQTSAPPADRSGPNLLQGGKQGSLPSLVVNRPAHFGLVLFAQRGSPNRLIAFVLSHV